MEIQNNQEKHDNEPIRVVDNTVPDVAGRDIIPTNSDIVTPDDVEVDKLDFLLKIVDL